MLALRFPSSEWGDVRSGLFTPLPWKPRRRWASGPAEHQVNTATYAMRRVAWLFLVAADVGSGILLPGVKQSSLSLCLVCLVRSFVANAEAWSAALRSGFSPISFGQIACLAGFCQLSLAAACLAEYRLSGPMKSCSEEAERAAVRVAVACATA